MFLFPVLTFGLKEFFSSRHQHFSILLKFQDSKFLKISEKNWFAEIQNDVLIEKFGIKEKDVAVIS